MSDSAFGRLLTNQREKKNISQRQMAEKLDRSVEWLCRLERGKIEPPHNRELMFSLALHYDVRPGVMFIAAGFIPVAETPIAVIDPEAFYEAILKVQADYETAKKKTKKGPAKAQKKKTAGAK